LNTASDLSSIELFANAVPKSGELPSGTPESIDSKRESPAFLMHEVIASLDGYFCSARRNFNWKRQGASRTFGWRASVIRDGSRGVPQKISPAR
jgi:hypothetical protein